MLIYFSPKDLAKIVGDHVFNTSLQSADKVEIDFGIKDGQIVAVVAVGEELPKLATVADLSAPRTSGSAQGASQAPSDEEEPEEDDDNGDEPNADGSPKPKRKRRTKAEIEADRLKQEQQAQEPTPAPVEESQPVQESAPVVEPNEADNTPPFDVDEGANLRAEAELLPDPTPVDAAEEDKAGATVDTDPNDPFANLGVSTEGDELFAQPDVAVTPVTEKADGFVKPSEPASDDPFASFN